MHHTERRLWSNANVQLQSTIQLRAKRASLTLCQLQHTLGITAAEVEAALGRVD